MAHGFEIYDEAGQLMFDTDSFAFVMVDCFEVTRPDSGSRSYPELPDDAELIVDWVGVDFVALLYSWEGNDIKQGAPVLDIAGKTLTYGWVDPNGGGYNMSKIIVRVFAR